MISINQITSLVQDECAMDKNSNRLIVGDGVIYAGATGYMYFGFVSKINPTSQKIAIQTEYGRTSCTIPSCKCISIKDIPKKYFTNNFKGIELESSRLNNMQKHKYYVNFFYIKDNGERGLGYCHLKTEMGKSKISKKQCEELKKNINKKYPNVKFYFLKHSYICYYRNANEMFEYTNSLNISNFKKTVNYYTNWTYNFNSSIYHKNNFVFYSLDTIIKDLESYKKMLSSTIEVNDVKFINAIKSLN